MIDFHSHILPRLDDGSKSSDMSVQMVEASKAYGVDVMVATPHFYVNYNTVDRFLSQREASFEALTTKLDKTGVEAPIIRLGAEVYYFSNMAELPGVDKLCIEGTRHLLLEMPFTEWTSRMLGDVEKLIYDCSIIPIIAHLDRYLSFQKHNNYIEDMIAMGAVVQMNGDYINGLFTKRNALKLIKSGVVSLLGSDCHNMEERAPNLGKSFKIVRAGCGDEVLKRIDRCGREILNLQS
jgi:protein-tyrosine phosphatase